jgi:predicted phage terminase large subunit-like protein
MIPPTRPTCDAGIDAVAAARQDPSAFAGFACTDPALRPLVQADVHRHLQEFLTAHPKAVVELPRDHGKTMQLCARVVWELGRNPALRVKFVCATEGIAAERGRFLRDTIAHNPRVRRVFPHLVPADPWGETRFTVRRPADVVGPSVTALGVGAGLTGTRADLLVCDDIVDVKALYSPADRARVKSFFKDNLMNLLDPGGRCWCLCTPWHTDDLNAELSRGGAFALFRRVVQADGTPVWPERWPRERLLERRREIGATAYARAYRLVPLSDETTPIRPAGVRYWVERPGGGWWGPLPEAENAGRDECRVVLAVDPAVSAGPRADASALVVLGRAPDRTVRCLAAVARRVPAPELVQLIAGLDRTWRPEVILFESNAAFAGIKDLLVRHAGFGARVHGVKQTRSKAARVAAFAVAVENGTFRLKGVPGGGVDPGQRELLNEMVLFPAGEHDDLLDAAAMGTEHLLGAREPRVWVW